MRVLASEIQGADGRVVGTTTIVGTLRDARRQASSALARVAAAGAIGLVVGGLALTLATRRALAPVGELAAAARATGGAGPAGSAGPRRVPEPERHDEIGVLAHEFNRMADRIAAGDEERRRLLAAVSHELRTPLAVAQGHLEMFESVPRGDDAARAELAAVLRDELGRLARVVGDLTTVASGDGGYEVDAGPVFVPDVLDDLRARLPGLGLDHVTVAGARHPSWCPPTRTGWASPSSTWSSTPDLHTPDGTTVTVTAEVEGTDVALAVRDDGPGLDPAVRDRAFEPFASTRSNGPRRHLGARPRRRQGAHRGPGRHGRAGHRPDRDHGHAPVRPPRLSRAAPTAATSPSGSSTVTRKTRPPRRPNRAPGPLRRITAARRSSRRLPR